MTPTMNGKAPRKQLSDQLNRLDGIIDTLSEGLNQAVVDASREGARAAVREVLVELLTNPDLLATMRPAQVESPTSAFWNRVKVAVSQSAIKAAAVASAAKATLRAATASVPAPGTMPLVLALAVLIGLIAGLVALVCPLWTGTALTALTSATSVGAAFVGVTSTGR